jgi:tetratricopeptide (TPR) repeat protein
LALERPSARRRLAAAVIVCVATSACATGNHGSSSRFVKKPEGFIDLGGASLGEAGGGIPPEEWDRARREAMVARAAARKEGPRSVEETDPELRTALASLKGAESVGAHVAVAGQYNRLRVWDMAYEHFSKALALDQKSIAALDGRARLLRDVGLLGMALGDAHRALFTAPDSAVARNTLGTILEKLGQCREAAFAYAEASRLSGGADWARENAARMSVSCAGKVVSVREQDHAGK